MWLINADKLTLEYFADTTNRDFPHYAILSHAWGADEVSFADFTSPEKGISKKGYDKIRNCCEIARSEGFDYAWIDTCCINKSSSAELSEAINSMFQWYRGAGVCYAYLSDVDRSDSPLSRSSSFARSRWFTRGWTLQELLAPLEVVFLDSAWVEIGTKRSLRSTLSSITRINESALERYRGGDFSVAQKMSWAAGRATTRLEDEAYYLMGLFDVNMPLLYGEGGKAFLRLQQEILKQSDDDSLFA